ncbi:MAG: trypsin-like peptidase domain-containing protein [Saprospiraceae bacterium]|nr:trypsin-like peptidase domain-containing protein [Saprospiraceae bacterium]
MKNLYFLPLCVAMFMGYIPESLSQNILQGVALIKTVNQEGSEGETGAGIVSGRTGDQLFIVTAYHVVKDAQSITVRLNQASWTEFPATLHYQVSEELDIAVVVAKIPANAPINYYEFRRGNIEELKVDQAVSCIGHPYGAEWTYNKMNTLTNTRLGTYQLGFSSLGVNPGFSGGALVERKKGRLLGLITEVSSGASATAVNIDEVINYLQKWRIPTNFLLPYKEPLNPLTYVFGGLAVAGVGAGLYFNKDGVDQYEIYKSNLDETAPVYQGLSRDDMLQKAKDDYKWRNISYAASGGFAVAAVLCNVIKKNKTRAAKPSKPIPNFFSQVDFFQESSQTGIRFTF